MRTRREALAAQVEIAPANTDEVLLAGLNEQQREVVLHEAGPLAVFAGAGSGKTACLVRRVARLVRLGVPADRIVCVTFSQAGAREMNERLKKLGCAATVQTWHALCLRVIREEGLPEAGWTVEDAKAKVSYKTLVKQAVGYRHENWVGADVGKIRSFVGICKANLWLPEDQETAEEARKRFGRDASRAVRVYSISQDLVRQNSLLLFDDMLVIVARHFAENEDARLAWAAKADHVMQDEAQDASRVQVTLAKQLAKDHKNYMIVGDPSQCIPEGQMVSTPNGYRPIQEITEGDQVHTVKAGEVVARRVLRKKVSRKTEAVEFDLGEFGRMRATPDHVMFAAISDPGGCFVYLMYRHDLGFRIGVSRTAGHNGLHFIIRTQQECAERLWVLRWFATYAEAAELEAEYAYAFGIPREPFVPRSDAWGDGPATTRLFGKFGQNGKSLLDAAGLDFERPNYFAKASGRGRVAVNILLATKDGHQVEVDTGVVDADECRSLGMAMTKRGTMRTRRCFRSLREAREEASRLASALGGYVTESLSGTGAKRRMRAVRAAGVHIGMEVPVVVDGKMRTARVLDRKMVKADRCYDLEVEDLATFIIGGVVVHNCIFGFRGANPKYLTEFPGEYSAKVITLATNYRSCRAVVRLANDVIREAEHRLPEDMIAARDLDGKVEVRPAGTLDDEARELAEFVKVRASGGQPISDVTVLYRTNAQSRALEEAFLGEKIPYVIVGGLNFYERKEVKDLLAYLRLASGRDREGDAVKRCINAPFRFLGARFVEKVGDEREADPEASWESCVVRAANQERIQERQRRSAFEWVGLIDECRKMIEAGVPKDVATPDGQAPAEMRPAKAFEVLNRVVVGTRYVEWLEKDEGEESIDASHASNVRELLRVAQQFATVGELLDFVERQVAESAKNQRGAKAANAVTMMTCHRSKGLEWPVVWVVGCVEGVMPHARGDEEEERRLFYVAATRARDHLILSSVAEMSTRSGSKTMDRSRFLEHVAVEPGEDVEEAPPESGEIEAAAIAEAGGTRVPGPDLGRMVAAFGDGDCGACGRKFSECGC